MIARTTILVGWLIAVLLVPRAEAYVLSGPKWTTSTVTMQLQLGSGSGVLLDGFTSWGTSAEDALAIWNNNIAATRFSVVRDSTASRASGNRINNVYFSNNVDGSAWGAGVLAVTLIYSVGSSETESDVLFNNQLTWNSYRGAPRTSGTGAPMYDFHRVALHEFGHSLGLDHPDEAGQSVSALMNSHISSLDALTADDIAGGRALYGTPGPVIAAPVITTQPVSRVVTVGQGVIFNVIANSSAPLSYQWIKAGTAIASATGSVLNLQSTISADAGNYWVTVSNSSGTVTSAVATLTVNAVSSPTPPPPAFVPPSPATPPPSSPTVPPAIATAPSSQTATAGTTVSLVVIATGTAPLSYQWRKDGNALSGATNSVLSVPNAQPANAGSYTVAVSNSAGSVMSAAAVLTIQSPPAIITPPADQAIIVGARLSLSVIATATPSPFYAWRKDGVPILGANAATYEVAEAQPSHAGSYTVVVTNPAGSVTSSPARVTVNSAPPAVAAPPQAQIATAGETVTFTVAATGTGPLSFQWLKDTRELPGATGPALTLTNVRPNDAGDYAVRISNSAGTLTTVAVALTVKSSRLVNLSTRAFIPAGGTLTPGFYIRGSGSKSLLIRAVGPTLAFFGIDSALAETRLEVLAQGSAVPLVRDSGLQPLSDSELAASVGAFPLLPGAKDAAMQASLIPRGYTVRVSPGTATMAGVTLAEIYDADTPVSAAQLVNVSTLGFVGAGENVLTAGFVVSGNAPKRLLIRAVGPALAAFGVGGTLADPQVALLRQGSAEPLATNDDWPNDATTTKAFTDAGAFALPAGSKDAALVATVEPGTYTVLVSSVTAAVTGQALVEIYDLDP